MTTPTSGPDPQDLERVAKAALLRVADGMTLGLGTGRAAEAFIEALGARVRGGLRVRGIPPPTKVRDLATRLNIPIIGLEDLDGHGIDIAFDGADEVTPTLELTKGLGGALLR